MKKNAAFEKWRAKRPENRGADAAETNLEYERRIFEAGQRASDPLRKEKEAVVKAAVRWFNSDRKEVNQDETKVKLIDSIIGLERAQRSRRHGR